MSRSYKRDIRKQDGWKRDNYHRAVRSNAKNKLRSLQSLNRSVNHIDIEPDEDLEELEFEHPRNIINDYDVIDYVSIGKNDKISK